MGSNSVAPMLPYTPTHTHTHTHTHTPDCSTRHWQKIRISRQLTISGTSEENVPSKRGQVTDARKTTHSDVSTNRSSAKRKYITNCGVTQNKGRTKIIFFLSFFCVTFSSHSLNLKKQESVCGGDQRTFTLNTEVGYRSNT